MKWDKQWVYKMIALLILLAGMCVDEVRADSLFVYPQTAGTGGLRIMDEVLVEVGAEPTELLCTCNSITSRQVIAQITNIRKTVKLSMLFLCVAVFLLLLSNFYTAERIVEYPRLSVRTAVLNYIHDIDGKK